MFLDKIKPLFCKLLNIKYPHSRVGEIWVCSFNGYSVSGEVVQSLRELRYIDHNLKEIYVHIVKVNNCHALGATHRWKELSCWDRDKTKFRLK